MYHSADYEWPAGNVVEINRMAKYDWKCLKCETVQELDKPMAEYNVPPEKCTREDCISVEFEKYLAGGGAFILRGEGWFRDGYR